MQTCRAMHLILIQLLRTVEIVQGCLLAMNAAPCRPCIKYDEDAF